MKVAPELMFIDGVPVALYPMPSIEIGVITIDFKAGSHYEKSSGWGAVHYMEHMVHEGSKAFPTRKLAEIFKEENAIYQNASTSGRILSFDAHFPAVSLKATMKLLTEVISYPTFPEHEMVKEKGVVIQEYRDSMSQPNVRFRKAKIKYIYGEHHITNRDPLGQPEYVSTLTRQQVVDTYTASVNKNTMSISVVGKFRRDLLIRELTQFITTVPQGPVRTLSYEVPQSQGEYLWHKEDMDKASLDIVYLLPERNAFTLKERTAIRIGSYILGGSPRSRIFQKLRGEHGLTYSAGSNIGFGYNNSDFVLYSSTSIANAKQAVTLLSEEFNKLLSGDIGDDEFERARKYINLTTLTSYDSPYRISETLSSQLFWDGYLTSIQEFIDAANTVEKDDIAALFQKHIGKPIVTVMSQEDPHLVS